MTTATKNPKTVKRETAPAERRIVKLEDLVACPTNPRSKVGDVEDLVNSIKSVGVLQPLLARPNPKKGGARLEVVFGHRRLAAARKAGLAEVPVDVRDLSDEEVLEAQLVENLQRSEVHPLDEADGYRRMHEEFGRDVDAIAAKVGKSRAYVYGRMKLCALTALPREKFRANEFSASVALLIARLAARESQEAATKRIVQENHNGRGQVELSYRGAAELIQSEFMLKLADAPFDVGDAELVPKAGSCAACPKRTGNDRLLFADVKNADVCTDAACWRSKCAAKFAIVAAAHKAKGGKVLESDAAAKLFDAHDKSKLGYTARERFVDLGERVHGYQSPGAENPTWRTALKGAEVQTVLASDRAGGIHELAPIGPAIDAAKATGAKWAKSLRKPATSSAGDAAKPLTQKERDAKWRKTQREAAKRRKLEQAATFARRAAIVDAFVEKRVEPETVRQLALVAIAASAYSTSDVVERRTGKQPGWSDGAAALAKIVKRANVIDALGILLELALVEVDESGDDEHLVALEKWLGIESPKEGKESGS